MEGTWFDGFAWNIASCSTCGKHIGMLSLSMWYLVGMSEYEMMY